MLFYLDTSALVKLYKTEDGSDFIKNLYDFLEQRVERLVTSEITDVEVTSAIFRHFRKGSLSQLEAVGIIYAFEAMSDKMVSYIPFSGEIIYGSKKLLSSYALRAMDSIQLASAIEARSIDNDIYFVADDERLCVSAEGEGFTVLRPRFTDSRKLLDVLLKSS